MKIKHFEEYYYVYDENNNLREIYENNILINRYQYNENNQIIREDNLHLKVSITYTYNASNKLIERNYYNFSLTELINIIYKDTFTYDSMDKLTTYNDEKIIYDNNYNLIKYRDANIKLSKDNQIIELDNYLFEYRNSLLLKKLNFKNQITNYYYKNNKLIKQKGSQTIQFIYQNNEILGLKLKNQKFYFKKDFNNNVIAILNSKNKIICKYVYDYFGNHNILICNKDYDNIAYLNPIRYHSYYFDVELGLYYINNNYYDPEINLLINKTIF